MKKKIFFGSTLLALVLCIFGCNFQFPESVSIKSNAKYEFAIANKSFPLGDLFSIEKIRNSFSGQSEESASSDEETVKTDFQIYDYNPSGAAKDDDVQQFLVSMNFQEIPLDFNNYLKDVDFGSKLESMNISKEIEVPNVDIDETKEVDVDIDEKINALVSFTGTTKTKADLSVSFDDLGSGFNSITYKSGYMVISNTPDLENYDFSDYGLGNISIPALIQTNKLAGTVRLLYQEEVKAEADFDEEGLARLPLDNVTVYKDGMSLEFTDTEGKTFFAFVSKESQVKEARGISLTDPVQTSVDTSFSVGNDSALKSCKISQGSLGVEFKIPEQWSGVSIVDSQIDLTGGMNVSLVYPNQEFDFGAPGATDEERTFVNTAINASTNISIKMTEATLIFIDEADKKIKPSVEVKVNIEKVESALVSLSEVSSESSGESVFRTTIEDSQELSGDILNAIQSIKWKPSGLSISYINTLPAENHLELKFNSSFFGITTNNQKRFESTTADERKTLEFFCADGYETKLGNNTAENEFNTIDYAAEVILPDYQEDSEGNKTITVKDVVPGQTYLIDLEITPKPDWYAVYVKSNITNQHGTISTGLNVSSLMKGMEDKLGDDFAGKITIKEIPLYLFCQVPEIEGIFNDLKFVGTINAYIGDENNIQVQGTENTYLLGSETGDEELYSRDIPIPDLKFKEGDSNVVINNLEQVDLLGVTSKDLSSIINSTADGSLCVDYNVRFESGTGGSVEILADKIKKLEDGSSTSIKLAGLIILPLSFDVNEQIDMDILKLVKGNNENEENSESEIDSGDLLGRSEPTNTEDFQKYLDIIESASIDYASKNRPFKFEGKNKGEELSSLVDLDGEGSDYQPQTLGIEKGSFKENPSRLLAIYPLKPSLNLKIPEGVLSIPRKMDFDLNINLTVQTNGKVTVWEKNAKIGGEE